MGKKSVKLHVMLHPLNYKDNFGAYVGTNKRLLKKLLTGCERSFEDYNAVYISYATRAALELEDGVYELTQSQDGEYEVKFDVLIYIGNAPVVCNITSSFGLEEGLYTLTKLEGE